MPSLLCLPGASGRAAFWAPVTARLAGQGPADRTGDPGPATLVGWPGFAGEPPDPSIGSLDQLFAWLVARLPPGASDVLAQSMGGVLALRLALERPERVRRLVLTATSGGLDVASLGEVRARTLLLWSDADPISPLAVGRTLQARLPDARLEVIPGGDHAFAENRADEVAAKVRAFLSAE